MLDLYSLFQGKISSFLVIYFSEQECYILLLQCPAIQYPSPGQTDHQVFILLHCLSRVQMHEIWLNERILVPDIRSNHHISQQNAQCTLYPGLFTAHYQKKQQSRRRRKTHIEAHLYAAGHISSNRRGFLVMI